MKPISPNEQQSLVERLMSACGGAYSPQIRRKYYISGPQWAAAYQGQALFHAPTREAIGFERVIEEYAKIGIGYWTTHDTDVIPTEALGKEEQSAIVSRIQSCLKKNGLECSMVTTETFYHAVWAASPAAEAPEVRDYAAFRVENTVGIGHELGAQFAVYWPGSLGYYVQGAIDETETLEVVRRRAERRMRSRYQDCETAQSSHAEALSRSQALRAASRDSAAHERRDAGLHWFRPTDASGNGRAQSGISA